MSKLKDLNPVFCDLEASSLWGYPIEVGWAWWNEKQVHSGSRLILPDPAWDVESTWDDAAAALHRITLNELRLHGLPCFNVARHMNDILEDRQVFTDSPLDHAWLGHIFEVADLDPNFHLREMLAGPLINVLAQETGVAEGQLKSIRLKVEAEYPHSHRAEPDAKQWAALWAALQIRSTGVS